MRRSPPRERPGGEARDEGERRRATALPESGLVGNANEMARRILITAGAVRAEGELDDSKTAAAIWDALPLTAKAETWGDEIYFDIGQVISSESPKAVVEPGSGHHRDVWLGL
jgi:hypothetical protein